MPVDPRSLFSPIKHPFWGGKEPIVAPIDYEKSPPPEIDINAILAKSPFWQAISQRYAAESVADRASRDAAIQRAMIDFGMLPGEGLPGLSGLSAEEIATILDPATREAISANTRSGMSVWARLQQAADQAKQTMMQNIGARGLFRSGETPYGLRQQAQAQAQGQYDAIKNVTDYLTGVQSAFVEAERARQAKLDEERQKIIETSDPIYNLPQLPPPWQPPAGAPPMPTTGIPFLPGIAKAAGTKPPKPKPMSTKGPYGLRFQ